MAAFDKMVWNAEQSDVSAASTVEFGMRAMKLSLLLLLDEVEVDGRDVEVARPRCTDAARDREKPASELEAELSSPLLVFSSDMLRERPLAWLSPPPRRAFLLLLGVSLADCALCVRR